MIAGVIALTAAVAVLVYGLVSQNGLTITAGLTSLASSVMAIIVAFDKHQQERSNHASGKEKLHQQESGSGSGQVHEAPGSKPAE